MWALSPDTREQPWPESGRGADLLHTDTQGSGLIAVQTTRLNLLCFPSRVHTCAPRPVGKHQGTLCHSLAACFAFVEHHPAFYELAVAIPTDIQYLGALSGVSGVKITNSPVGQEQFVNLAFGSLLMAMVKHVALQPQNTDRVKLYLRILQSADMIDVFMTAVNCLSIQKILLNYMLEVNLNILSFAIRFVN